MTFEFDGKRYAKASAHQKEWGSKLIAELDLRGDERILDLGCGDGAITAQLAQLVPHGSVVGIDASEGMIEAARAHATANLTFLLVDINALDLAENFDLVFSNATLHWVKDHRALLANVLAILADDGIARLNFAASGNCSHFYRVIRQVMASGTYSHCFSGFEWPWFMPTVDEYTALLNELPFAEARVWGENADRYFPDSEAMVGWIDQPCIVPFLKHVSPPDKQRFRDEVVERMVQATHQKDGTCFETFRRINVFARR